MPGGGVEPPRPCDRRILSPLRLPVPPSRPGVGCCSKKYRTGLALSASATLACGPDGVLGDRVGISIGAWLCRASATSPDGCKRPFF